MNLLAIAIDDEPLALEIIQEFAKITKGITLTHTFENALEGEEYLQNNKTDILFVDIDMPDLNGIDLVTRLSPRPIIIFTTAYKEFALEGFELEAVDYLLKPFSHERFEKAIQKAVANYNLKKEENEKGLFVYSEYKMIRIPFEEILYIESLDDYIKIHLSESKPILTLQTLKKTMELLPEKNFMRIHRSYIISLNQFHVLNGRKIVLKSGVELPVSESYIGEINSWINRS